MNKKIGVGILLTLAVIATSQTEMFQANPLPLNSTNFEIGKALYNEHCVSCHGDSGRGDGIDAHTLSEVPADLSEIPSFPSGFLEFTIKNGGDTDVMPTWENKLTQREIYLVANYVRLL